jgi:putative spermidine/putrescine transport system substrate-binding protein
MAQDNINRRNFIKYASMTSVAAAAGCLGGDGGDGSDGGSDDLETGERPVQWIGPAYSNYEEQVSKYEEVTGVDLEATRNSLSDVQQRVLGGGSETFDVVSVDTATAGALTIDNNATDPVPTDALDRWDESKASDLFTNPSERISQIGAQTDTMIEQLWEDDEKTQLKFPPTVYNFDAIGYNPKFIEPGGVSEWSALFNDEYSGQVLFDALPAIGIPETLMHMLDNDMVEGDIGQLNDPSQDQMDAAIDFLIREKEGGQFRSTWTAYGNSVNLMASEDAILGDIWQPAALSVRRNGTSCKYATMSEGIQGYRFWWAGIMPTNPGAEERNNMAEVQNLIDMHYGAWFPGFIQEFGYSVPQYANEELVRDGSDETGQGMGPEYYDWAYRGSRTYEAIEDPYLFDPASYEWSMEEGDPNPDGQKRDSGPIEERIDRISFFQIWPSNADYMLDRWSEFEAA